jgi:hypothetical protein
MRANLSGKKNTRPGLMGEEGAARLIRTAIELLAQPKSMRSIIGASQREPRRGAASN